ncbi:MAG: VOC family protein [Clostridia bacterium]|nr:VOC family protein [Clostridia bacterium]
MSKVNGFHHIALKASDFEKTVAFYKALGLTEKVRWGEGDGRAVMLNLGDGGCIEVFAGGEKRERVDERWLHLAMKTSDVDAAYKTAIEAGAVSHIEPKTVSPEGSVPKIEMRIAFVYGPDGELIEFFDER